MTAEQAALLDVPAGAPLLAITRTVTDSNGDPIEFSRDGRAQVVELHPRAPPA